jgi:hypothetical protein
MGNIGIHSRKEQRFICHECQKTFSARKGTVFYRLRTSAETVVIVVTLLAHGCPLQAIVAAFGFDERTIATWWARSGRQGQAVHEYLVEQPRDLGQVQADELRVKKQGGIVWMALAIMVQTRLWLGGEVSEQRDLPLIRRLIERVRRCAARRPLLVCTDGLVSYIRAIRETFRDPVPTSGAGSSRPTAALSTARPHASRRSDSARRAMASSIRPLSSNGTENRVKPCYSSSERSRSGRSAPRATDSDSANEYRPWKLMWRWTSGESRATSAEAPCIPSARNCCSAASI